MRRVANALLLGLTAPLFLGWLFPLAMCVIWAAHSLRMEGAVLTAVWRPWAAKRWRWSTALSMGVVYQPTARVNPSLCTSSVQDHEHVHVRQAQDRTLLALVVGVVVGAVTGNWWLTLGLWLSGGLWQLPNMLAGALRHGFSMEGAYYSTEHERSARAQTSRWCGGKAWCMHDGELQRGGHR